MMMNGGGPEIEVMDDDPPPVPAAPDSASPDDLRAMAEAAGAARRARAAQAEEAAKPPAVADAGFKAPAPSALASVIGEVEQEAAAKVFGNLSTNDLRRELATSVLKEEERVNIDEMKKRAITKARSYEEFRQMVLCANLKPMKSKELEALGQSRPNQRAFAHNTVASRPGATSTTTGRFRRRGAAGAADPGAAATDATTAAAAAAVMARARAKAPVGPGLSTKTPKKKPKNRSEFQRDWQRGCKTVALQAAYLRFVGSARIKKVLAKGIPSGMLGELVEALATMTDQVVAAAAAAGAATGAEEAAGAAGAAAEQTLAAAGGGKKPKVSKRGPVFVCKVLVSICAAVGFAMETMFLSEKERKRVQGMLSGLEATGKCPEAELATVREAFNFDG